MNVTVTTKGNKVTARSGNRRKTIDGTGYTAQDHGRAAIALVTKIVPGYRRAEILNSVQVAHVEATKTGYHYKD